MCKNMDEKIEKKQTKTWDSLLPYFLGILIPFSTV